MLGMTVWVESGRVDYDFVVGDLLHSPGDAAALTYTSLDLGEPMGITGANVRGALAAPQDYEVEMSGPELVWLKPKIKDAIDGIDGATRATRAVSTPEIEGKRKDATGYDVAHDGWHRAGHGAFGLAEIVLAKKDPAARKVVAAGKISLYPTGLDITQLTWAGEGDETHLFMQRLERPEVKAALTLVETVVPGVVDFMGAAVTAGSSLGKTMRELAVLEAGRGETPQMFAARTRGMQVLSLLRAAVDEAYPASNKANAVVREKLIGRYLELLDLAADDSDDSGGTGGGGTGNTGTGGGGTGNTGTGGGTGNAGTGGTS